MKFLKELLWMLIAVIISVMVLLPIINKIDYKFLDINIFIICLSVIYIRLFLDFKTFYLFKYKWLKYIVFSLNFFILIYVIGKVQQSLMLFDIFTINSYTNHVVILPLETESKLIHYINTEFLFFGVLSVSATILLSIRLLKSFWSNQSISEF